jgi:ABC-type lipoprotein release transport system permease subunit
MVVGVVINSHYNELRQSAPPLVYVPLIGSYTYSLYVRSPLAATQITRIVERQLAEIGGVHIRTAIPLETLVGGTLRRERLLATVASTLGLLGGFLAGIGLFGFLTLFVTQRKKEIGIRVALGAQPRQIIGFALAEVLWLIVAGLAIGLLVALLSLSTLKTLLFDLQPWDPAVAGVAALTFLLIGLIALGLPAIRASGIDPTEALREQ